MAVNERKCRKAIDVMDRLISSRRLRALGTPLKEIGSVLGGISDLVSRFDGEKFYDDIGVDDVHRGIVKNVYMAAVKLRLDADGLGNSADFILRDFIVDEIDGGDPSTFWDGICRLVNLTAVLLIHQAFASVQVMVDDDVKELEQIANGVTDRRNSVLMDDVHTLVYLLVHSKKPISVADAKRTVMKLEQFMLPKGLVRALNDLVVRGIGRRNKILKVAYRRPADRVGDLVNQILDWGEDVGELIGRVVRESESVE